MHAVRSSILGALRSSILGTSIRRGSSSARVLDGGMGVLLPKLGMPKDPIIWSARALVEERYHPLVVKAHREFIEAGASVIITNSYAVIPGYLKKANRVDEASALCDLAGRLAREAAGPKGKESSAMVLGSLPPLVDSYRADLLLPEDEAVAWYSMMSEAMLPHVDAFICETISCLPEARAALKALERSCPDMPAWVSFTVTSEGKCRDGMAFNDAVKGLRDFRNVSGIGVNCCMPEAVEIAMECLEGDSEAAAFARDRERIVYANAYPKEHSEGLEYDTENFDDEAVRADLGVEKYAAIAESWARRDSLPFTVIGGCCGIFPDHIERVAAKLQRVR